MRGEYFKKILAFNIKTGEEVSFRNIWDASLALKISVSWLRQLLNTGNASTAGWCVDCL